MTFLLDGFDDYYTDFDYFFIFKSTTIFGGIRIIFWVVSGTRIAVFVSFLFIYFYYFYFEDAFEIEAALNQELGDIRYTFVIAPKTPSA